ncbi:MAG: alpha-glucan family phosphorylase [Bacteroidales bacterium]|jgi:phosphorylase/glycogen(starch) synthase|nr:alpha-glucan family phosphorylase [Bacteroidales bacterium]
MEKYNKPDFLFEISWEICNKIGGIYTVLSTKSSLLNSEFGDNQIYIGPDVWMETSQTPDFEIDESLFKSWTSVAHDEGLLFRIGRWKVPGNPIVILIDFKQYFQEKNEIFAKFWELYKLDSISGQWDYIEPAMFGYAAAKIIESFYKFNISASDTIVAQFHEWMSGMGILYLKNKLPQIGTIFTTHATIIGRSIAGNEMALYKELDHINANEIAHKFNLNSKYSLEKLSIELCDILTTVSEITSRECKAIYGREADIITPNGIDRAMAPNMDFCNEKRIPARMCMLNVAKAMFNKEFPEDTPIIITSGRYEFRNKGIDMFLETLARMNNPEINKETLAFITVPANSISPVSELHDKLFNNSLNEVTEKHLTHYIHNPENDPILNACSRFNLNNDINSNVKVIFVPVYLNGNDGIFNLKYYDLLAGADLTVFASYYEPWGYTPLESLVFGVPTITTDLAGFGLWINEHFGMSEVATVLHRDDNNYKDAEDNLLINIKSFINKDISVREELRKEAFSLSNNFLWDKLIDYYHKAYESSLILSLSRKDLYRDKLQDHEQNVLSDEKSAPIWRKVFVKQDMPESLKNLKKLSMNLWWCWNPEAEELFRSINPERWEELHHNPIALFESLSVQEISKLESDSEFTNTLAKVYKNFEDYINVPMDEKKTSIAYFSMEFGLHNTLKIYSGGLGILAGDYLKEMSDRNENITGIGLLYRYGYFNQSLSHNGEQIGIVTPQRFTHLPIKPLYDENGELIKINIALPARNLTAKIWRTDVGRVSLYLLDTDIPDNWDSDRAVTHQLYGGDNENRFKQELLLGIGGIRLLRRLNINPKLYHLNEGHAAFAGLERLREFIKDKNFKFNEAMEIVRSSTLFTTHTPVPAGHDSFSEDILRTYIPHYSERLNISWNELINMGKIHPNSNEKFSMSVLAINTAQEVNGVSKIHGRVSREMFLDLYPGYYSNELFIGYVTNGVHYPTWVAEKWRNLHVEAFGNGFLSDQSNPDYWKKIYDVDDSKIWDISNVLRNDLIESLRKRIANEMTSRQESPAMILQTINELSPHKLTIGFARRFATYKRAHLLFQNLERLNSIINSEKHPVQFIFSGKAHPADKAGQDLIKQIIEVSRKPEFIGKIVFVENYDMETAKLIIQGVDIWLNTPTRPLEASGTSGEKAIMNGVLNLSVLDGWWAEGYRENAGWALKEERTYENQHYQDILDSETLYLIIENKIARLFYDRDENNIPHNWVQYVKNNFAEISPHYTMKRMTDDYFNNFYSKLEKRTDNYINSNYQDAFDYAAWKKNMIRNWDQIQVKSVNFPEPDTIKYKIGEEFEASVVLKLNGISAEDIAVEIIVGQKDTDRSKPYSKLMRMKVGKKIGSSVEFYIKEQILIPGILDISIRVRPDNKMMPYPQDLKLVKWI